MTEAKIISPEVYGRNIHLFPAPATLKAINYGCRSTNEQFTGAGLYPLTQHEYLEFILTNFGHLMLAERNPRLLANIPAAEPQTELGLLIPVIEPLTVSIPQREALALRHSGLSTNTMLTGALILNESFIAGHPHRIDYTDGSQYYPWVNRLGQKWPG